MVDTDKERARLEKEIGKINQELQRVEGKLNNESFTGKAPADVIEKEKAKQREYRDILEKLQESLSKLN